MVGFDKNKLQILQKPKSFNHHFTLITITIIHCHCHTKPNKKEKEIVRYHNFRNTYFASYEQLNNMNAQKCLVITTYT